MLVVRRKRLQDLVGKSTIELSNQLNFSFSLPKKKVFVVIKNMTKNIILCSACLLGVNCKYNGENNFNERVIELTQDNFLIPICPEQLSGLKTPQESVEIKRREVITKSGKNVTDNFKKGAKETFKIAKIFGVKKSYFETKKSFFMMELFWEVLSIEMVLLVLY